MAGVTSDTSAAVAGTGFALHAMGVTPWPPLRRFSVDEYYRMAELGIFSADEQVELLDGWVFNMSPAGPSHSSIISHIGFLFARLLPDGWHVRTEQPLQLNDSVPQPDVSIIRGRALDYQNQHPTAQDTALVMEVSASSLQIDRGLKASIYAAAGISTYWIVDIQARQVEVFRHSQPGTSDAAPRYESPTVTAMQAEVRFPLDGKELVVPVARLFS